MQKQLQSLFWEIAILYFNTLLPLNPCQYKTDTFILSNGWEKHMKHV